MGRYFIRMGPKDTQVGFATACAFGPSGASSNPTAVLLGGTGQLAPAGASVVAVPAALLTSTGQFGPKAIAISRSALSIPASFAASNFTGQAVSAAPVFNSAPAPTFTDTLGTQTFDLKTVVSNFNAATMVFSLSAGSSSLNSGTSGISLSTDGILTFNDAVGGVGTLTNIQVEINYSADADFASRGTVGTNGVVMSQGFGTLVVSGDTKVDGYSRSGGGSTPNRMAADTTIRCSGTQSLRLNMADPQADSAGQYLLFYGSSTFGEGTTFYVQYRWRCSPEFLSNNAGGGKKISVLHYLDSSCADVEVTVINQFNSNTFKLYTHCGADHPNSVASPTILPNTWYTIDQRVTIGNWGVANSYIQAWITPAGSSTRTQFIEAPNFTIFNAPPVFPGFNRMSLTPYDTGATSAPGGFVWYDEAIVSTSPIALPVATPLGG